MIFGLSPFLVFGVIAAATTAAYFFRRRSTIVDVPAVVVWNRIGNPVRLNSIASVLASTLSLLLQLLIVALVVLALWNPFPTAEAAKRVALIVDTSATMQTREGGGTRFDAAVAQAHQQLAGLPTDAEVTLVAAGARPTLVRPRPMTPADAASELGRLKPTGADSDVESAVRTVAFVAADPAATVSVYSDFAGVDPAVVRGASTGPAAVTLHPVGSDRPDAAIVDAWLHAGRGRQQIGISLRGRGMTGQGVNVSLWSNGQQIKQQTVTLDDAATVPCEFEADLPAGATCDIRVASGDDLAADDRAYFVVPAQRRPVLLVTAGNPPLRAALRADPDSDVRVIGPEQFNGRADGATVIFDQTCNGRLPMSRLPVDASGVLLIGTADPFAPPAAPVADPKPTHWATSAPILNGVAADLIRFNRAVAAATPGRAILSADRVPLIDEIDGPGAGKTVRWLFDLADTDLPQRVAFPVLLWNTIDALRGEAADPPAASTGRPTVLPVAGRPASRAVADDGTTVGVRSIDATQQSFEAAHAGVYRLDDAAGTRVGVSYLSERPLRLLPKVTTQSVEARATAQSWRPPWWHFAVAALAFAVVELGLFRAGWLRIGRG